MTDLPVLPLALDFTRAWCPKHAAGLRPRWPHGAGLATVLLFYAFVDDERTLKMAGGDPADGRPALADFLPRLIDECQPLCCFVGGPLARQIVREAVAGAGPLVDALNARQVTPGG